MNYDKIYINGNWVKSFSKDTIEVENPANKEIIGSVPASNKEDIDSAVKAAKDALKSWETRSLDERIGFLEKILGELNKIKDEISEVIDKAGLPKGVFNLLPGRGSEVGNVLASHKDVDMISFTGSTEGGRQVSKLALESVKKIALELGGKSPSVILKGADYNLALKKTLNSIYGNTGSSVYRAPFGGYKHSGIGREGGTYGLEEFLEIKAIFI